MKTFSGSGRINRAPHLLPRWAVLFSSLVLLSCSSQASSNQVRAVQQADGVTVEASAKEKDGHLQLNWRIHNTSTRPQWVVKQPLDPNGQPVPGSWPLYSEAGNGQGLEFSLKVFPLPDGIIPAAPMLAEVAELAPGETLEGEAQQRYPLIGDVPYGLDEGLLPAVRRGRLCVEVLAKPPRKDSRGQLAVAHMGSAADVAASQKLACSDWMQW